MLLVTHNLEEAFELGDRMLVYRQGRIVQQGPPREVYERPASTAVAQLLGLSDVTEAVVSELDPENNRTRLQAGELRILTPYLPGRSAGDRVQLCIRPERVIAAPSNGAVERQRLALPLTDVIEMPDQVRLVFPGAFSACVSRALYEKGKSARRWTLEFPPDAVWVFPATRGSRFLSLGAVAWGFPGAGSARLRLRRVENRATNGSSLVNENAGC